MLSCVIAILLGISGIWVSIRHLFPWLVNDVTLLCWFFKAKWNLKRYASTKPFYTLNSRLIERAKKNDEKPFIIFEDETYSYKQINDRSCQIGRAFHEVNVETEETIGVMMTNSHDFINVWFGINKAGCIPAFINYKLCSTPLIHCLEMSQCSKIVVSDDDDILKTIKDAEEKLIELGITVYINGSTPVSSYTGYRSLTEIANRQTKEETPQEWISHITLKTHFCYIFTSGTTGLPKAAIIAHSRSIMASEIFCLYEITSQDIIYTTLPLYHASSALLGVLGTLRVGSTMVLKKRFSASSLWKDCRKHNVTVVQYIGEIMRYVCNQPKNINEKHHSVRMAVGNGLSPGVWDEFLERFGPEIVISEFYSSTEGNIGFYNITGVRHRVGMSSPLINYITGVVFIKYDFAHDEVVRDSNGRCVEAEIGEPGLLLRKITNMALFLGYRGDIDLTKKATLSDVFKLGDRYFCSGDIMLRNVDYTVSFIDRLGDTFRWKGENVSTYEVGDIMSRAPFISEANAYGVKVPGAEGRAGMMVVVLKPDCKKLDGEGVYSYACASLPPYARPVFIRVQKEMPITGTWKQVKVNLVNEGIDLQKIGNDSVYYMNSATRKYIPLTQAVLNSINDGTFYF